MKTSMLIALRSTVLTILFTLAIVWAAYGGMLALSRLFCWLGESACSLG